eukprot:CAMPEP_0181446864 /NCGR_PEP_ID=MMETSP1110-20121109/26328_1 /TAXON_ID=174948 /ORGANISM="Symbiodinium sp., Strain CCMP421" /LENGTH=81 /DNA_ID=CAMNT_0023570963 /DNA_START=1 /DNA_END=242 /DNA_ORIENTATION=-
MPVPTEMPTSPVLTTSRPDAPTLEAPTGLEMPAERSVPSGGLDLDAELPVPDQSALMSSGMASSMTSPSEMPVPTEMPTSP